MEGWVGGNFPGCVPVGIYAQVCMCACVHTLALLLHQSITWRSVFQTYRLLYLTHSRCSINASWADFPVVLALLPRSSISGGFKANNIALVFLMNLIQNLKSWETRNILQENQIYIRSMKSWNRNIFVLFSPSLSFSCTRFWKVTWSRKEKEYIH